MLRRPVHIQQRSIRGRTFSERVTIIRTIGEFNVYGEYHESTMETETLCATATPITLANPARLRVITEGGLVLSASRVFWTIETLEPVSDSSAGDILLYMGERWRVRETNRWFGFNESVAERQEGQ